MAEILHPFLSKFRQILRGNIDQYFFEKECFRSSFYSDYPPFWTRPPRDMKLGNWCATCVQYPSSCATKLARKCEIEHCLSCGADGRAGGVRSRDYQIFWDGQIYLPMVLRRRASRARAPLLNERSLIHVLSIQILSKITEIQSYTFKISTSMLFTRFNIRQLYLYLVRVFTFVFKPLTCKQATQ